MQEDIGIVNPLKYGSALNATTLNAAITAIGSVNKRTLFLSTGAWTLASNVTVTSNITLWISAGATVAINAGVTLTFNMCPASIGEYQIFTGSGTVTFAADAMCEVQAAWWGAAPSASAAVNATAIQAALDASAGSVLLGRGTYSYSTGLLIRLASPRLRGHGMAATTLSYTGADTAIHASGGVGNDNWRGSITDLRVTTSTGVFGIRFTNLVDFTVERVYITGFSNSGIFLESTGSGVVISIKIHDCDITLNAAGVVATGANNTVNHIVISGSRIRANTGANLDVQSIVVGWDVHGNDFEAGGLTGPVNFTGAYGLHYAGNYHEATIAGAYLLQVQHGRGIGIFGNVFEGATVKTNCIVLGTAVLSVTGVTVQGNSFFNCDYGIKNTAVSQALEGPNSFSGTGPVSATVHLICDAYPGSNYVTEHSSAGVNFDVCGVGNSGVGTPVLNRLVKSYALNFAAVAAVPGCVDSPVQTFTGAVLGDRVVASSSRVWQEATLILFGVVNAADQIFFRWCQLSGAAFDPDTAAGATYRAEIVKGN